MTASAPPDPDEVRAERNRVSALGGVVAAVAYVGLSYLAALYGTRAMALGVVVATPILFVRQLYLTLVRSTFGVVRILYRQSQCRTGERLTVRFGKLDGGAWQEGVELTLRCVEKRRRSDRPGRWRALFESSTIDKTLHEDFLWYAADELPLPGSDIDVWFDIPPGLPGTVEQVDTDSGVTVRWVLHVSCPAAVSEGGLEFTLPINSAQNRHSNPTPSP